MTTAIANIAQTRCALSHPRKRVYVPPSTSSCNKPAASTATESAAAAAAADAQSAPPQTYSETQHSLHDSNLISVSSPCIVYEGSSSTHPLVISGQPSATYHNRHGAFRHEDLVGKTYGKKLFARTTQGKKGAGNKPNGAQASGWVYLLPFSPDLWTMSLRHRTQILYQADISYTLMQLDLKPGDVVFESGTGSGSLTTAMATTVAPRQFCRFAEASYACLTISRQCADRHRRLSLSRVVVYPSVLCLFVDGHVHTFEFNAERVVEARKDFAMNGVSDVITVRHRDIVKNGFPLIEGGVNAVFLDLPAPWSVVNSCQAVLVHQGRFCSFSPCIEQVQRTCLALDALGFSEIVTVEVLLRNMEVYSETSRVLPKKKINIPSLAASTSSASSSSSSDSSASSSAPAATAGSSEESADSNPLKKRKLEDGQASDAATETDATSSTPAPAAASSSATASSAPAPPVETPSYPTLPSPLVRTRPYQLQRGHTGYLTFATCNKY